METRTETKQNITTPSTTTSPRPTTGNTGNSTTGAVMNAARETLNQGVEKVSQSTNEIYETTIDYCRRNPGAAMGIAVASGVTLGFILGRSSKSRFDDSIWGAVTLAAVRTVLDRWR